MRSASRFASAFLLLLLAATGMAGAADPCADPKSHQFDFWIGEWDVSAGGGAAGKSRIEPILQGCVIQEHWSGAQGGEGTSLNFYDPETGKWHQKWVWRQGTQLALEGGLVGGSMVLEGDKKDKDGKVVRNRITWTPNADGTVRQLWESSGDLGKTWQTSFDGLYRRKK